MKSSVFKFGMKYWKRNIPVSLFCKFLSAIALLAELWMPLITSMFINYCILDLDPADERSLFAFLVSGRYGAVRSPELFRTLAVVFLSLLFIRMVLIYWRNILREKAGLNIETDMREATFHKLMELDSTTISKYNAGELLTTINSDTIMFKELFCRIYPNMFDAIFVLVAVAVILARINPWLLFIPAAVTPFFSICLIRFRRQARQNFLNIRKNHAKMSLAVQENIEAVRLVRSFTNEELEKSKFDRVNEEVKASHIAQVRLQSRFDVVFNSIRQIAYIGSVAICAVLVMNGILQIGLIATTTSYINRIMGFVQQLNGTVFQMQQQLVSGRKMMDFMEKDTLVKDGAAVVEKPVRADLGIHGANLVLEGKHVLKNIDLDIPYGKKVGIVGGTGSGKSVLLESLLRIHDLTGGEITLNGKDIREYDLDSLRQEFSYVFQDVFLFSNTIDSNIAYYAPEVEKNLVVQAAQHAQAHSFIGTLDDGYETVVGERGIGISGGQKQRVSIARALLKNAPVIVLDDSTSALDVETERALLADIKENFPEKTLLIAAHRLSSVVDCDEILYMQDGMVVERGSFDELMKLGGHFAEVYRIQQADASVNFDAMAEKEKIQQRND